MRVGDRLLVREEAEIGATIFPTEPVREIEGRIIALVSSERLASQLDSVLINLGSRDSVKVGDVFAVSKEDAITVDEIERDRMSFRDRMRAIMNRESLTLPGGELGTLLVYRTFETMSYAVLLSSLEPISERPGDQSLTFFSAFLRSRMNYGTCRNLRPRAAADNRCRTLS